MKNISLVLLALILTITFTASDLGFEKGNKPEEAKKCPYLENLQQHSQLECPYLKGTEGNSACPYMKEKSESQTGCPYLDDQMSGECPYLNRKGQKASKEIKYYPLPEGKST